MTKAQFSKAWQIAQSNQDLSNIDDTILHGCGLPKFQRVVTTIETVAKLLRWQCCNMFGDGFDANELANMASIAKNKFNVLID